MRYTHSLPPTPSFEGKGLFGYTFGPLQQKDVDVYYVSRRDGSKRGGADCQAIQPME